MDGYRQTLLGRALADALREIEAAGGENAAAIDGDAAFALFDEAVRAELAAGLRASSRRKKRQKTDAQGGGGDASVVEEDDAAAPPVFTHRSLALDARLRSFNRFEDKWSLQAAVPSGGLVLDHVPVRWGADRGRHVEEEQILGAQEEQQEGGEGSEGDDGATLPMLVKLQQLQGGVKTSKK